QADDRHREDREDDDEPDSALIALLLLGEHPHGLGLVLVAHHFSNAGIGCQVRSRPILPPSRMPRNRLLVPRTVRSTKNRRMISLKNVAVVPRPNSTGL